MLGREAREQVLADEGRLPEVAIACVGGGSNAIGLFAGFLEDAEVRLIGVEAGGAASLGTGRPAVLHGSRSSVLADEDGQVLDAESISAGLDYPGVGPEHAFLRDRGRAEYLGASDEEALEAFRRLADGGILRRSSRRTPSRGSRTSRRSWCWSASRAGATRTWPRWPPGEGAVPGPRPNPQPPPTQGEKP